jgi:ectoine hydroxylase-related dioxygenase (phytanoyl-CoA dioxygenase family)
MPFNSLLFNSLQRYSLPPSGVAFFRKNGFLIVPGVLGAEELRRVDAAVARIVTEETPLGEQATRLEWEPELVGRERVPRRIYNPVHQHPEFERVALSDAVLDPVASIFGPNLQFHHSKLNMKGARVGSVVEWHQDFAYFPHTNPDLLACLIYLDDAGEENGCLQVIPGAHGGRAFGHSLDGAFAGKITEAGWRTGLAEPVKCEGRAGSMILMHCMTPHASLPNRSGRSRRTLILEYRAADAYPIYYHEQTHRTEAFARQVRGSRMPTARVTLTSFPMPQLQGDHSSLYDLQSRSPRNI